MVLSLPMRDGNVIYAKKSLLFWNVLSLPMRDGNHKCSNCGRILCESFELTYEGWKLRKIEKSCHIVEVLSLPMRDGNDAQTIVENALAQVLSLPMRDGNIALPRHITPDRLF